MFSKSLFKQSCKANGMMWLIITVAVCFMLSCVMLISGGGGISQTKNAIQDTIIEEELTSSVQDKALTYYEIGNAALAHFDETFTAEYTKALTAALQSGAGAEQAAQAAVSSPLLETSINGATGVLINIAGSHDLGLDDVETAANIVMEAANPDANIIFGATFSEDFEDEMRVTVIATGFDEKKPESKGIYSSSKPAAGSKQQSIPADAASDINDIDEIFKIFNK